VNSETGDVRGVVGALQSLRPVSSLQLGLLDQISEQPVAQAAAAPGCAVAFLAWGELARAGLGR
jgi:hypothetical protein